MDLREEVEKLAVCHFVDSSKHSRPYLRRDDVLALLDKYELVAEYENGEVAFVRLWLKSEGPQDITQDICVEDAQCVYVYRKGGQR